MEMPILAERCGGSSSPARTSRMRSATRLASPSSDSGRTRANSSPPYRAAADKMAVTVVDIFQAIEVKKQHGEGPAGAVGAVRLVFEDVEQAAIIGEAGERIADSKMVDLFKELGVIEKRAAQRDRVAHHNEGLGENKRGVQQAHRLSGGELGGDVQPSCGIKSAVKSGIIGAQPAAVPDQTNQKNGRREQLLRARKESRGMRRNLRRQMAERCREHIRQSNYREQCSGDLSPWMTGTRKEPLNEQGHEKKQRQDHAAHPPGRRRPKEAQGSVR